MKIKYILALSIASFVSFGFYILPAEASCGAKESSISSENPCAGQNPCAGAK